MTIILVFLLTIGVGALAFFAFISSNLDRRVHAPARQAAAAAYAFKLRHGLRYAVAGPGGGAVGLRPDDRQIVVLLPNGLMREFAYAALRAIALTPVRSTFSESTGEVSTRRGSQLIGAGLGAMVAGPAGLVVGGLSAGQTQQSTTTSIDTATDLELELFFRDEDVPRFLIRAGVALGGSSYLQPDLGEEFKDMAARLANIVESGLDRTN